MHYYDNSCGLKLSHCTVSALSVDSSQVCSCILQCLIAPNNTYFCVAVRIASSLCSCYLQPSLDSAVFGMQNTCSTNVCVAASQIHDISTVLWLSISIITSHTAGGCTMCIRIHISHPMLGPAVKSPLFPPGTRVAGTMMHDRCTHNHVHSCSDETVAMPRPILPMPSPASGSWKCSLAIFCAVLVLRFNL